MLETVVGAIIPIVLTILLGFLAGWRHDENPSTAKPINTMVLRYALPLALFAATVANPRDKLLSQGPLALILLVGLLVPAVLAFGVRYLVSRDMTASVLQALGFGFPAIPFVGIPILTPLIGPAATIVVAVGGCIINLLLVPPAFVLLSLGKGKGGGGKNAKKDQSSDAKPAAQNSDDSKQGKSTKEGDDSKKGDAQPKGIGAIILNSLKQPVVWAPVCGLILILLNVPIPKPVQTAVTFLGSTSGAVSLFASGIILQAQKPTISWPIAISTLARNLVIPGATLLILRLLHVDHQLTKTAVLALAMPAAAMQITLALEYQTDEQENASFLLYSNLLSIGSVALLIFLVK